MIEVVGEAKSGKPNGCYRIVPRVVPVTSVFLRVTAVTLPSPGGRGDRFPAFPEGNGNAIYGNNAIRLSAKIFMPRASGWLIAFTMIVTYGIPCRHKRP